jgi:phosphoribosylanthranilate isomerase
MSHKPLVYVSRITNLSDARYCAGMGVDMLGYRVDPDQEDYVNPAQYQEMVGWISGPKRVIEITSPGLDLAQLSKDYQPDMVHMPVSIIGKYTLDIPLILEVPIVEWQHWMGELAKLASSVTHIVITGVLPHHAQSLDTGTYSILISLDRYDGQLIPLLQKTHAAGFALRGSKELGPGLTDYEHLSRVLEELDD